MAPSQGRLSNQDIDFYNQEGYIVVEDVLDAATLERIHATMNSWTEGARAVTRHTALFDLEPSHSSDSPRVRRFKTPHIHHPLFWEVAQTPILIEMLTQLLGSDVRLKNSKINLKSPRFGAPVEWHQDWAFYPHTNDDLLAIGVMLDDCTMENGPLLVLPGSHKGPVYDHHSEGYFCGAIDPEAAGLDFNEAVPLTGPAGSVSFHHARLVHGSAQNRSQLSRALLLYELAAADAWPLAGVSDIEAFDAQLLTGKPTVKPRMTSVPVRMPLPPAPRQGSIYENQSIAKNRFFSTQEAVAT